LPAQNPRCHHTGAHAANQEDHARKKIGRRDLSGEKINERKTRSEGNRIKKTVDQPEQTSDQQKDTHHITGSSLIDHGFEFKKRPHKADVQEHIRCKQEHKRHTGLFDSHKNGKMMVWKLQ
jgi:hypothetical protein